MHRRRFNTIDWFDANGSSNLPSWTKLVFLAGFPNGKRARRSRSWRVRNETLELRCLCGRLLHVIIEARHKKTKGSSQREVHTVSTDQIQRAWRRISKCYPTKNPRRSSCSYLESYVLRGDHGSKCTIQITWIVPRWKRKKQLGSECCSRRRRTEPRSRVHSLPMMVLLIVPSSSSTQTFLLKAPL